ncbi:IclR family transcriptional regulator C-terminal domain-containing protein [Dactylosporangium sp. NPDC049742]|uniref:IclR family transcriptional regulator n=1 Tax=Dactylosporangium sp. NPDC049742 TaxID=3154737 RepID=UPI003423601C
MDDRTVTGRVLAVLDAVADLDGRATLAALTARTGVPKPTVRRIAADLVGRGMLDRDAGRYRLGRRLLMLGVEAARQQGVRQSVAPYVHDLFARTGEVAWMTTFTDTSNTLLESAFGSQRAADMRRPWPSVIRSPGFLTTAAGRLVLAHRPDLVEDVRSRALPRLTRYTITNWHRIAVDVARVRDTRVAVEQKQTLLGYSCVAAGVHDRDGVLIGAIGVTGRTGAFVPERLAAPIRTAADQLSRLIAQP